MSDVVDAPARAAAIDPAGSFCVSAPAGSGKTELLIQRYLGLLSRVGRPEQVLAITFTRKAAAEMRARVLAALEAARAGAPCATPHDQVTRELAAAALRADAALGWHLARDVSRLNIRTIDGFCHGLTGQMPVLSAFGGQASPLDDATELYREAVRELFRSLESTGSVELKAVLADFDNDWGRVEELLVAMLGRRDQWRAYLAPGDDPGAVENYLEEAVATLVAQELTPIHALLAGRGAELLAHLQYACANLGQAEPGRFPLPLAQDLPAWRGLRKLLLTKEGDWRKSADARIGFPAGKGEANAHRNDLLQLIGELGDIEGLLPKLAALDALPATSASDGAWQRVLHLSRLLPALAVKLLLVFRRHGAVDHNQVAQAALQALGDDDAPTELALRLDYRIEHILVDEFQDTSVNQYDLLHKLTRGWGEHNRENPGKPRTLMIVGDAMQSIYGFRGTNVGLFLKAREEGFNGVRLRHLQLECNFRSQAGIVDWVNATFAAAFPREEDINRAQVRYSAATAVRPAGDEPAVTLRAFYGERAREAEVDYVADCVADCLGHPGESVAVLGRTRGHLQAVAARLRERALPCCAQELESLDTSAVASDLLTLCAALANDADRLAWMALLRAPWCGLTLADLSVVAEAAPEPAPLRAALPDPALHRGLSADGRARLQRILPVLATARASRDRLSLRVWIEQAWTGLGGPACCTGASQLADAESFFQLLELAETEGAGLDSDWLALQLAKRYTSGGDPTARVQLMTLHRAKGLEFDRVIIPRLNGIPRSDGRDLLLWDEYRDASGERRFLIAARDVSRDGEATLYNYLRSRREEKSLLENTRLLYVGATRAVRRLYLSASPAWDEAREAFRPPPKTSLLRTIWPVFEAQAEREATGPGADDSVPRAVAAPLQRLTLDAMPGSTPPQAPAAGKGLNRPEPADNHFERSVGTVVHGALEALARRGELQPAAGDEARWRAALQGEGLWGEVLEAAIAAVREALDVALAPGGAGRWILDPGHGDAHSEWSLSVVDRERVREIVIDRSFVDRETGVRWIIDYKTSRPFAGESLQAFAARESARYREQLRGYRNALRALRGEPVRCALFFTATGYLHPVEEEEELDLPAEPLR